MVTFLLLFYLFRGVAWLMRLLFAGRYATLQRDSQQYFEKRVHKAEEEGRRVRVLLIGGTGAVGQNIAKRLLSAYFSRPCEVYLCGRKSSRCAAVVEQLVAEGFDPKLLHYVVLDLHHGKEAIVEAMKNMDLVVHSASPFQNAPPVVLEAAIASKIDYIDVCGDIEFCKRCVKLKAGAQRARIKAITAGGVFPGLANVMGAELVEAFAAKGKKVKSLEFNYFVAGTGGLGPTPITTTLLVASRPNLTMRDGKEHWVPYFSHPKNVDFGKPVGVRGCGFYEQTEVYSMHRSYRVLNVCSRFGMAPGMFRSFLYWLSRSAPASWLANLRFNHIVMTSISPLMDIVDLFTGRTLAIAVTAKSKTSVTETGKTKTNGTRKKKKRRGRKTDEAKATGDAQDNVTSLSEEGAEMAESRYIHSNGVVATATCVVAMIEEMLAEEGGIGPGVWFPEEAIQRKARFIERTTVDAINFSRL
ncbi:hypothetical protein QOT17_002554 [Balamuthia mandrillaris]